MEIVVNLVKSEICLMQVRRNFDYCYSLTSIYIVSVITLFHSYFVLNGTFKQKIFILLSQIVLQTLVHLFLIFHYKSDKILKYPYQVLINVRALWPILILT